MNKPTRREDLLPPFTAIGEGDWAERLSGPAFRLGPPLDPAHCEAPLVHRNEKPTPVHPCSQFAPVFGERMKKGLTPHRRKSFPHNAEDRS
jgi:hypothetical protein